MICWAASWLGEDKINFDSEFISSRKAMIKGIYNLINEADVVIGYNLNKFDMRVLNAEFIVQGLKPIKPIETIDLYRVVKKRFEFPSYKLAYIIKTLKLGFKGEVDHDTWAKCLSGDDEAWFLVEEYNRNDVKILKPLYETVKGWITKHPNWGHYIESDDLVCPTCGGEHLSPRGYRYTKTKAYRRYVCNSCGSWPSARLSEKRDDKNLLA